jgi:hypothetical protein
MIQIFIILAALAAVFTGGMKAASIYYTGKMAKERVVVLEDQSKKTKASQQSSEILNDFGNDEQLKSDAIADQMNNEVDEEDAKAPNDTRSRVILSREWLRKLDAIR